MPFDKSALKIQSGWELERFDLGTVRIGNTDYTVLTGYEGTGRCFWCGGELKGKLKRYCYGHMVEYYRHFQWQSASQWALERAEYRCQNCGNDQRYIQDGWNLKSNLEVHHIVPLKGEPRFFSAFNLPWNLVVLCHLCHIEIHRVMSLPKTTAIDPWKLAKITGQQLMELPL